jgi:methylated-DNA-[protein]-cysteine S-methyltransferase
MNDIYFSFPTRMGEVSVTSDRRALTGFYFEGQKYHPKLEPRFERDDGFDLFVRVREQFDSYEAGRRNDFDAPLALHGTPFQRRVWQALLAVRFGETISYGELARRVGAPRAVRAVGAAVGRNPISVIVPCHRIIGSDGSLTGYAGGLERKRRLLRLEGSLPA